MDKDPKTLRGTDQATFRRQVEAKTAMKLRAQRHPPRSVLLGFGVSGIIGWSIVVPTFLGAMLGLYLDGRYPRGGRSWTLMLLIAGLCIGCFQAWNWIAREDKAMQQNQEEEDG